MKKLALNKIQNSILRSVVVVGVFIIIVGVQPSKGFFESGKKIVLVADRKDGTMLDK